jgi:hypothetical protein
MSEHDANKALETTARLRMLGADKLMLDLESTQPMPVFDRRMRATEGAVTHRDTQETATYAVLNRPVFLTDTPDFRDGQCVHGESRFTCPLCTVQDGRRDV